MADNEKTNGFVDEIKDKVNDVIDDVKEKVEELKENAPEIKAEIKEKFQDVKEDVKEAYGKASAKAQETVEEIKSEIDDYTAEQDPEDVKNNKLMAILAYLNVLVLIPVFCAKDSKFAKFHANQGLILFIIELVLAILFKIPLLGFIFKIVEIAVVVMAVVGIIYAIQGKAKELPVIGNWTILK